MNKTWKNEKLVAAQAGYLPVTRHSRAKFRRNYRSVEKKMITKSSHAAGMRPVCHSKELDRTNGLDFYDFEARAYDPVLMRFTRPDPLAEKYPSISPYVFCNNNPLLNIDPTGEDYWSTNDPEEIQRFISSIGTSTNAFENFNFSSWDHATDVDFTGNLTFNDKTNTFYSSYNTIENGELVVHGVSIKAQSVGKENATVQTWYGKWLERSSGRAENVYPEFAVIVPLRAGTSAVTGLAKWIWDQMSSPMGTTNTFDANKSGFAKGSTKNERKINADAQDAAKKRIEMLEEQKSNAKTVAEKQVIQNRIKHERLKATQKSEPHGRTSGRH